MVAGRFLALTWFAGRRRDILSASESFHLRCAEVGVHVRASCLAGTRERLYVRGGDSLFWGKVDAEIRTLN
jgi:hypothetical protein